MAKQIRSNRKPWIQDHSNGTLKCTFRISPRYWNSIHEYKDAFGTVVWMKLSVGGRDLYQSVQFGRIEEYFTKFRGWILAALPRRPHMFSRPQLLRVVENFDARISCFRSYRRLVVFNIGVDSVSCIETRWRENNLSGRRILRATKKLHGQTSTWKQQQQKNLISVGWQSIPNNKTLNISNTRTLNVRAPSVMTTNAK